MCFVSPPKPSSADSQAKPQIKQVYAEKYNKNSISNNENKEFNI
jgi:hypothetical protein